MKANRKGEGAVQAIAGDPAKTLLFVRSLKLTDFRNYARAELELDARPVVLVGENGAGKTNLLEAVSLLGPGHGLRGRHYDELCRERRRRRLRRRGPRRVARGRGRDRHRARRGRRARRRPAGPCASPAKSRSAGALAEYVNLVWLIPAMDGLFTGPASERRRFLDRLVLAVDPKMRSPLGRYDRAMRQRNRLFQMREGSRALFEGLEEQMAEAGVAIAAARLEATARLAG